MSTAPPTPPAAALDDATIDDATADDPTAARRKDDHIQLAFAAQVRGDALDARFDYEPLLAAHPAPGSLPAVPFLGGELRAPLWVSSMTGGTARARAINDNLARACREFGMGMGLGSCRPLLYDDARLGDFDMRARLGDGLPLYANLGVAQVERLYDEGEVWRVPRLLDRLRADGLIVHVNPLQEWLQPEGDRFARPPVETIERLLAEFPDTPIIVKEVGQGMGPASLRRLLRLPVAAIEFAAGGGTNFARLELLRSDPVRRTVYEALERVGQSALRMVLDANAAVADLGDERRCSQLIISGGVRDFLDGYYLRSLSALPSVYGQASAFLRHATGDYDALRDYVAGQLRGLELATAFLTARPPRA